MHSVKQSGDHLQTIVITGALVFAMQYLTLVLLSQMLVAYTLALFQLGMLLQVFLGYLTIYGILHHPLLPQL